MVAELDDIVARLRAVDELGAAIAVEARPEVERAIRATAAAGQTPSGETWAKTEEGNAPLKNAASAISVEISGATKATLAIVLRGHHRFHHFGSKKGSGHGLPKRQIIPMSADELPASAKKAIADAAARVVARTMGGGR